MPAFGGLSDGGPVLVPYIDRLAFHARADLLFVADSGQRQRDFVIPYGFSVAALHLVEGGITTHATFWKEGQRDYTYSAPLSFHLKVRLWRWFTKDPNQHFTVVAAYQHELRTGPFDGPNQLGLLTDLGAIRIAASWPVGPVDLGASAGALYDYQGRLAIGELGGRLGLRLDFIGLPDTRVSVEGIVRGVPSHIQADALLPGAADQSNPIHPSGALFLGVNTRMVKSADFGLWTQKGFGDVAPLSFGVRVLGIFMGEGYLRPRPIWAEVIKDLAAWIREQLQARKLPESFQQTCLLYGRNGQLIAALGHLTDDGEHCEFQGRRFRIGDTLYPDPVHRRVCIEPEATHCVGALSSEDASLKSFEISPSSGAEPNPANSPQASHLDPAVLRRLINQGALGPIQGSLDGRCILNEGEHEVSPIGHLSADRKYCVVKRDVNIIKNGKKLRTKVQEVPIPIGQPVYRDPTTGRVCLSKNANSSKDCPALLNPEHNRPFSPGTEAGYHGAIALTDWAQEKLDGIQDTAHLLTNPAELTTAALKAQERAEQAGKKAIDTLRDPNKAKQAAYEAWNSTVDAAHAKWEDANNWYYLPTQKKINRVVEEGVKGGLDLGATLAVGAVVPGRTGLKVAEEALGKDAASGATHLLGEASEIKNPELLPKRDPGMRGKPAPPTVDPRTGQHVGRFVADNKGNVLIEPAGGSTVAAGKHGIDTHTQYPNGSNYQRLNPKGHDNNPNPHGHGHLPGTGPGKNGQGPSLGTQGNVVPFNSNDAHWPIR